MRTIKIGAETSGLVSEVMVDVNDQVRPNQVLARIEPVRLDAAVQQANAQISSARASVLQADASIARSAATVTETARTRERARKLSQRGFISANGLNAAEAEADRAVADHRGAYAQAASARAELQRAQAQYADARTTLSRSLIVSPIAGIVISRQVDEGQTLASNFQAPVLFEIATNLDRMRVEANVNEADVGRVSVGQVARVKAESYPTEELRGEVAQIKPQASDTGGIITYVVIVEVSNPDRRLLPGMSATVEIVTASREKVVTVPLAALNFKPPAEGTGWAIPQVKSVRVQRGNGPSKGPISVQRTVEPAPEKDASVNTTVWRIDPESPRGAVPVPVKIGLRGTGVAEIVAGDLKVGDLVAIGVKGAT
jgi:HlyD family secretion protein